MVAVPAVPWIYTEAVLSLFALKLPPLSKRLFEFGGTFPDESATMLVAADTRLGGDVADLSAGLHSMSDNATGDRDDESV